MVTTQSVRESLEMNPRDMLGLRLIRIQWRFLQGILLLAFVAFVVALARGFWQSWQTGQWTADYWNTIQVFAGLSSFVLLAPLMSIGLSLFARVATSGTFLSSIRSLGEAVMAGDDRLAPVAARQPISNDGSPLSADSARTRFALQASLDDKLLMPPQLRWIVLGSCGLALLMMVFPALDLFRVSGLAFGGLGVFIAALFILTGRAFPNVRLVGVVADDAGIAWGPTSPYSQQKRIEWRDAHGFFLLTLPGAGGRNPRTLYALLSAEHTFIWDVAHDSTEASRMASEEMCRLIVSRTRLPLRDISVTCAPLASTSPRATRAWWAQVRTLRDTGEPLPPVRKHRRGGAFRSAFLQIGLALPFVFSATFYGGAYVAQRFQADSYARLLARARSHPQVYSDSFAVADGDWPTRAPIADDLSAYGFANGAYVITSHTSDATRTFPQALAPGIYGDVAVEVTARLTGEARYEGIGLVLHVTGNGDNEVVFTVNPLDQEWSIFHYGEGTQADPGNKWGYVSREDGAVINHAAGGSNKLAAIVRGAQIICFVNERFVGAFNDPDPHSGGVGVNVLASQATGTFTDFSVYPLGV